MYVHVYTFFQSNLNELTDNFIKYSIIFFYTLYFTYSEFDFLNKIEKHFAIEFEHEIIHA